MNIAPTRQKHNVLKMMTNIILFNIKKQPKDFKQLKEEES